MRAFILITSDDPSDERARYEITPADPRCPCLEFCHQQGRLEVLSSVEPGISDYEDVHAPFGELWVPTNKGPECIEIEGEE